MAESIIQKEKKCFITGAEYQLDKHHCMHGGANRRLAEKYGLWVWLRHDIHMLLHDKDKSLDRELEQEAQKAFEKKYSHEKWMELFRKNYI